MSGIRPYQFVGYWGYGNPNQLEHLLAIVWRGVTAKRFSQQHEECFWGVGYLGLEAADIEVVMNSVHLSPQPSPLGRGESNSSLPLQGRGAGGDRYGLAEPYYLATLSASGLHDVPDAWVKVQGKCLILGREPFGRVPLYWTQIGQVIWFASRLQLLLPVIETPQHSIPAVYGYSCFSYVPTPLTPVETSFAIPAGTELIWQQAEKTHNPQFTIHNRNQWQEAPVLLRDEGEAITQLQTLLKDAIHRQIQQLPSEPVGVFLSGGIDSSTIAALLVQAGVKVRAYALDFEPILGNNRFNEFPYAQQVAEFLKIPLVKVAVTSQKIRQAIPTAAKALDLPFGDGAPLPLFLLSQIASQETSVIFNGENGDQLFAGWTNKPLIAAGIYNTENPAGAKHFHQQYLETFHALYGYEALCFQPDVYAQVQSLNPQDWLQDALAPNFCSHLIARLRRATLMLKGAQNIQPRANNLALSQGLWVRSPFCDLPLTEWAFQLPGEFCLQGVCEKYILKRAVESWLPSDVVWREKQGMAVPITALCLNALRDEVKTWLSPSRLQQQGIWQPQLPFKVISGQMGGHIRGGRMGRILWLLMMWQAWAITVLGENYQSNNPVEIISRLFYDACYFPPFNWNAKT